MIHIHILYCAQRGKPPPKRLTTTKSMLDSSPNFRINPDSDPDVCRIAHKMLWIQSVSYRRQSFRRLSWKSAEMVINLLKLPISQWWGKWKSDLESVYGNGSPSKVDQFFEMVDSIIIPSVSEIGRLSLFTDGQNDRQTYHWSHDSALAEVLFSSAECQWWVISNCEDDATVRSGKISVRVSREADDQMMTLLRFFNLV